MTDPPERDDARRFKLRTLVSAARTGISDKDRWIQSAHPSGTLDDGSCLWILADYQQPERALGSALLEAAGRKRRDLVVFYDDPDSAAKAARRVQALDPKPEVRLIDGRVSRLVDPAPLPKRLVMPDPPDRFEEICYSSGVEPICEHGIWRGEVLGLEVARAVGGGVMVGVGRVDQETALLVHPGRPVAEALTEAANHVRAHRHAGAGTHPLATLARERWLRHDLLKESTRVAITDLVPVDPADERFGLRSRSPAPAIGLDRGGRRVLVVCTVGVDAAIVPAIADLVLREVPDQVLVAMPPSDMLGAVERAISQLAISAAVVGVRGSWERSG